MMSLMGKWRIADYFLGILDGFSRKMLNWRLCENMSGINAEIRRSAYVNYRDACIKMAHWIAYYNSERLHSAIWYLTPDDVFNGRTARRLAERKEKLHTAFIKRQAYWQSLNASA